MSGLPPVPATGPVRLVGGIKAAFPNVGGKVLSFRGRHANLPAAGPVRFSQFRGLAAHSPDHVLSDATGTNGVGVRAGAFTGYGGSLTYDLSTFVGNAAYQGAVSYSIQQGTLPGGVSLSSTGVLTLTNVTTTPGLVSVTIRATNMYGQVSDIPMTFNFAVPVTILDPFMIDCADYESFFLNKNGELYAWGYNTNGVVGIDYDGNGGSSQTSAQSIKNSGSISGRTVVAISAGQTHALALDTTGKIHSWGGASFGQLGDGSTLPYRKTIPFSKFIQGSLSGLTVTHIAAGGNQSMALDSTGTLHAWGENTSGQVGNGLTTNVLSPVSLAAQGSLSGLQVRDMACGGTHSVALDLSGRLHAWGKNTNGQLGDSTTTDRTIPISLANAGSISGRVITRIACGSTATVALDSTGTVHVWGAGLLSDNYTHTQRNSPTSWMVGSLSAAIVKEISAGNNHFMVIDDAGRLHAWGFNSEYQLGNGANTSQYQPVSLLNSGSLSGCLVSAVACGLEHTLAVDSTGRLHAWGSSGSSGYWSYTLGPVTGTDKTRPRLSSLTNFQKALTRPLARTVRPNMIGAGSDYSVTVDSTLVPHAWGINSGGQLGTGNTTQQSVPALVVSSGSLSGCSVVQIAAEDLHTVALDSTGVVHAWGTNSFGAVGNGSAAGTVLTQPVSLAGKGSLGVITKVGVGKSFTVALDTNGFLHSWGNNSEGQLGLWTVSLSGQMLPTRVNSGTLSGGARKVVDFAVGGRHVIALDMLQTLHVWGVNDNGQLGLDSMGSTSGPYQLADALYGGVSYGSLSGNYTMFYRLACGDNHTFVLDANGVLHGFGANDQGQLGDGTLSGRRVPVSLLGKGSLSGAFVKEVSAGSLHTVALDVNGVLHAWGANANGQLGDGSGTRQTLPVSLENKGSLSGRVISAVTCGSTHTLAVDSLGSLHAWGNNVNSQLGNGVLVNSATPVLVSSFGSLASKTVLLRELFVEGVTLPTPAMAADARSLTGFANNDRINSWGDCFIMTTPNTYEYSYVQTGGYNGKPYVSPYGSMLKFKSNSNINFGKITAAMIIRTTSGGLYTTMLQLQLSFGGLFSVFVDSGAGVMRVKTMKNPMATYSEVIANIPLTTGTWYRIMIKMDRDTNQNEVYWTSSTTPDIHNKFAYRQDAAGGSGTFSYSFNMFQTAYFRLWNESLSQPQMKLVWDDMTNL